mmetsp:Transcript_4442/g.6492  ORF Transcript_4442/g.6492 Transcript_4442/m.6492 type:complete len:317 (+) Transcript_4442:2348-3298(+)
MQIILKRCTRDQDSKLSLHHTHHFAEGGMLVFDTVRLVDNEVLPGDLGQGSPLAQDALVGSDQDIKPWLFGSWIERQILVDEFVALGLGPAHLTSLYARTPLFDFAHPVPHHALGDYDDVRASDPPALPQVGQQRDGLQRLAQAHLVGEDAIDAVVVQFDEPVEALQLVGVHFADGREVGGLFVEADGAALGLRGFEELRVFFCFCHAPFLPAGACFAGGGFAACCHRAGEKVRKDFALRAQILQAMVRVLLLLVLLRHLLLLQVHQLHALFSRLFHLVLLLLRQQRVLLLAVLLAIVLFFRRRFFWLVFRVFDSS